MNLVGNIVINLYSVVFLIIIYFHSLKQVEKAALHYKIYRMMLKATVLLLFVDTLSRFDGKPGTIYPLLNHLGNFFIYFLNLFIPSLWVLYVHSQIYQEEKKTRKVFYQLIVFNCVNFVFVLVSEYFGWLYYIDNKNIYHRGPLFFIPVCMILAFIIYAYVIIFINRNRMEKVHYNALSFFAIPPCLGIFLQIVCYNVPLMLNCVVVSLLIVFLNIQNRSMYTDYLTGVKNRKKLDIYLNEKISTSTNDKTFSAIMLDLNNFKDINDNYGHDAGDDALRITAKLLNNCLGVNDFIARYGGDEFCVVLDIANEKDLKEIVFKINNYFDEFNETKVQPYNLGFSIGYAVYQTYMTMEEFQKQLDMLMYHNKKHNRSDM